MPWDDEAGLPVACCGRAIDNTEVEVRAAEGEEGEVYISGACLCRGYFRDPEATSAFGGATRAFRSFDLGRWQATKGGKSLVILGRCNQLVKVRGQRVALSFVEASLCSEQLAVALGRQSAGPVFSEAVCVVTREGALVAAVILAPAWREVALADVRRCLGQQLPGAAVPALRAVAALPRLGTGKVDRRAARDLAEEPGATLSDLPPAAGLEDLRELWQACLPLKVEDWSCSFADAGGDSAGLMKLASLLRQKMGVDYDAVMAAAAESFAALARMCEAAAKAPCELQAPASPAWKAARRGPSPLPGPDVRAAPAWLARGGTCWAPEPVSEVSLSWRADDLHQCVDASPLLVPGDSWRLLIGSHSHELACFDADTGTELWRVTLTDRLEGACAWGLGPEEEACAFAAGYDGKMHCVSVARGALRWSQLVAPEDQDRDTEVKSAPVVAGQVVLTGTHGGSVAGLCCRSGRRLWRVPAPGAVFAPLLVAPEHMYVCTTTGQSLSKFHFAGGDFAERPRHQRSRRLAAPIFAAPLPLSASEAAEAAALVLSVEGLLRRVELEELTDLWVRQLPGHCFGTPCLCHAENLAFVGTHGEQVLCIDLADGAIRWQVSIGDVVYGSPFLVEPSRNPALCIATRRGKLFFLDARDGSAISTSAQLEGEDVVIDLECDLPVGSKLLDLSATFTGPLGLQTLQAEALLQEAAPSAECVFQRWRLRLAELLRELLRRGEARLKEAQDLVQEFLKELRLARQEVPLLEGLLEDVQGQVAEAVSRQDWYMLDPQKSWGAHYLRSLSRAHLSQVCNNFKDPGVQGYGGELFQDVRDVADEIFLKLPPPNPAVRSGARSPRSEWRGGRACDVGGAELLVLEVTRALDFAHNDVETASLLVAHQHPVPEFQSVRVFLPSVEEKLLISSLGFPSGPSHRQTTQRCRSPGEAGDACAFALVAELARRPAPWPVGMPVGMPFHPSLMFDPEIDDEEMNAEQKAMERAAKRLRVEGQASANYVRNQTAFQEVGVEQEDFFFSVRRNEFWDRYVALTEGEHALATTSAGRWFRREGVEGLRPDESQDIRQNKRELIIPTRWVRTNKNENIHNANKSRLVVQGFKTGPLGSTEGTLPQPLIFMQFILLSKDIKNAYFFGKAMLTDEKKQLESLAGELIWIVRQLWCDLAYENGCSMLWIDREQNMADVLTEANRDKTGLKTFLREGHLCLVQTEANKQSEELKRTQRCRADSSKEALRGQRRAVRSAPAVDMSHYYDASGFLYDQPRGILRFLEKQFLARAPGGAGRPRMAAPPKRHFRRPTAPVVQDEFSPEVPLTWKRQARKAPKLPQLNKMRITLGNQRLLGGTGWTPRGTLLAIPELGSAEESAADLARRLVGEILPKREEAESPWTDLDAVRTHQNSPEDHHSAMAQDLAYQVLQQVERSSTPGSEVSLGSRSVSSSRAQSLAWRICREGAPSSAAERVSVCSGSVAARNIAQVLSKCPQLRLALSAIRDVVMSASSQQKPAAVSGHEWHQELSDNAEGYGTAHVARDVVMSASSQQVPAAASGLEWHQELSDNAESGFFSHVDFHGKRLLRHFGDFEHSPSPVLALGSGSKAAGAAGGPIRDGDLVALCLTVRCLQRTGALPLLRLDLCGELITCEGARTIAAVLQVSPALASLALRRTHVADAGAAAIAAALSSSQLLELDLGECAVSDAGLRYLVRGPKVHGAPPRLASLLLDGNATSDEGAIEVISFIEGGASAISCVSVHPAPPRFLSQEVEAALQVACELAGVQLERKGQVMSLETLASRCGQPQRRLDQQTLMASRWNLGWDGGAVLGVGRGCGALRGEYRWACLATTYRLLATPVAPVLFAREKQHPRQSNPSKLMHLPLVQN
ncbi:unnamed protein product [Effrenium voratum]|nr:unnamed protein product [Effrenium voratum]